MKYIEVTESNNGNHHLSVFASSNLLNVNVNYILFSPRSRSISGAFLTSSFNFERTAR